MSQEAKIVISAQDKATGVLNGIKSKLGGLGTAAKGMLALFAFDKLKEFFGYMAEVGGNASAEMKNGIQGVKDTMTGFTVELAKNILGNKELMTTVKQLMAAIFPLVNVLVKALVPIFVSLTKTIMTVWEAIRPLVELILGILIPAFENTTRILQIAANGFLMVKEAVRGNWQEVARLRKENDGLFTAMKKAPKFIKVDLSAADYKSAEAVGKKVRESMEKGAKKDTPVFKDLLPKRTFGTVNTTTQAAVGPKAIEAKNISLPETFTKQRDEFSARQAEWYEEQKERAAQFIDGFGAIVSDGFTNIFSGRLTEGIRGFFANAVGSIAEGFRNFTLQWMKSQGVFLAFQAKIYALYGKIMAGLAKLLGNPFTAGLAALGIAAALTGLSRTLGGGSSGGPSFVAGGSFGNTQRQIAEVGNGQGNITVVFPEGLVDLSNPTTQRQFTKLINEVAGNRSLNLVGA